MLNIPNAIKALFKADSVNKNFRVQFPNGEFPDITNENIVTETIKFQESVCSQDVFRYGLAEASAIEFETVGIGNMLGMLISCSVEIDTSSLSAAQLAEIQADPGDGTLVLAADSDINYGYYRIPYGQFKVSACPRNHQEMTHRRVTAYTSFKGGSGDNSPFEVGKLALQAWPQKGAYTPDVTKIVYAALGWSNAEVLSGLTKTEGDAWSTWQTETGPLFYSNEAPGCVVEVINATWKTVPINDPNALHALELNGATGVSSALEWAAQKFDGFGVLTVYKAALLDGLRRALSVHLHAMPDAYDGTTWAIDGDIPVFYPYFVNDTYQMFYAIRVPVSATIRIAYPPGSGISTDSQAFTLISTTPKVYSFSDPGTEMRGNFPATGTATKTLIDRTEEIETYVGAYDYTTLLNSYLELNAMFGKADRFGGYYTFRLDASSPVEIQPEDYSQGECWWDEYDVQPIGTIKFVWGEEGASNITEYSFGPGASIYDMSENYMLQHLGSADEATIKAMLNQLFIPNLSTVGFTPVELTMQAMPFVEAGDALEITAEDGTIVNTFALRRELTGIQALFDAITASAGEIIAEV